MSMKNYSAVTEEVKTLAALCTKNNHITPDLYDTHQVKRGLRDLDGKGVVTGLTEISHIVSSKTVDGKSVPCEGELYYRGIDVKHLVNGFLSENRFGFEETVYLLLFGELPSEAALADFRMLLADARTLPKNFVRDVIMKAPNEDIMNSLAKSVLTLYSYDKNANDLSIPNVLRQCLHLIANFPLLSVYSYRAYRHYIKGKGLIIHNPDKNLSTAENILRLLRPDKSFTPLEARLLDLALVLHAEHGGGNNSTFTNHVVTSSGTDTYSAMAASLCSLKGPKHGGANIKVTHMFRDIKKHVSDWEDEDALRAYLTKILNKEAFDRTGLIYGMGHAVYSISDPRAGVFRDFVGKLSVEKGREKEFALYNKVAELSTEIISEKRKIYKGVSPNIDFYSGFAYSMMELPEELYTPIFAVARVAGWSAHRIEELINAGKIIRPAYKAVSKTAPYVKLSERK